MLKRLIAVEETIVYKDEIVVKQPEDMANSEFERILDEVEKQCKEDSAKDVANILKRKYGFEIIRQSYNFPESPDTSELEITSVQIIED